jgi:hypothetical protein
LPHVPRVSHCKTRAKTDGGGIGIEKMCRSKFYEKVWR